MKKVLVLLALLLGCACGLAKECPKCCRYPYIIPEPQKLTPVNGDFQLPATLTVAAPKDLWLGPLQKAYAQNVKNGKVNIVAKKANCTFELTKKNVPENEEGYTLSIQKGKILVRARDVRGLYYGMQTICAFLLERKNPAALPCCEIQDWPDLKMRGLFFELPGISSKQTARLCQVIDMLGAMKYNVILAEFADNFPFPNSPFIRKDTFTKQNIADIMAAAKRNHIQIIPKLQVASHAPWISRHPHWEQFKECESSHKWGWCYCLSNQEAHEIVKMVITETANVLKPKYFHMGLDEIYNGSFRKCPKCKAKDPVDLICDHVLPLQKMLLDRGITPISYQDEYLRSTQTRGYNVLVPVLDRMDKRVMVNSWEYGIRVSPVQGKEVQERGHKLIYMSWDDRIENTMNLPILGKEVNAEGCILAYWYSQPATFDGWNGIHGSRITAYPATIYQANYSWKAKALPLHQLPIECHQYIRRRLDSKALPKLAGPATPYPMGKVFNRLAGKDSQLPTFNEACLKKAQEILKADKAQFQLATQKDSCAVSVLKGSKDDCYATTLAVFPVNSKINGSSILYAAAPKNNIPFCSNRNYKPCIGYLHIEYADGTKIKKELFYRVQINEWNDNFGGYEARVACKINDATGNITNFYALDWDNPHPEKPVKLIGITSNRKDDVAIAIYAMSLFGAEKAPASATVDFNALAKRTTFVKTGNDSTLKKLTRFANEDCSNCRIIVQNGSWKKAYVNDPKYGKVFQVTIPKLSKPTGRFVVDVPVPADGNFKAVNYAFKCNHADKVTRVDLYIMGKKSGSANGRLNFERSMSDNTWYDISMPMELLTSKENGGVKKGEYKSARLSFWLTAPESDLVFQISEVATTDLSYASRFDLRRKVTP